MTKFSDFDLISPIQQTLSEKGYSQPTPIQAKALPPAIDGRDVLGIAQTGTGKTAAFALPILNWLGRNVRKSQPKHPFALILAPTRELAIQIGDSLTAYGQKLRLRVCTIYGGVGQGRQVNQLKRGSHILVATPGRLLDLMGQGHLYLSALEFFVLDEADRMLDMGFLPALKRIIRELPQQRQSLFFSATIPPAINGLAKQLLHEPVTVTIAPKSVDVEKIEQRFVLLEKGEKQRTLRKMLTGKGVDRAIVFTRTKRGANRLSEYLEKNGVRAVAIHGNKSQSARQKALAAFRSNQVKVLVATDVAARGIDIQGVSHVFNFDLPTEPESYVHRIGRTGRAGAEGIAVSFCLREERRELRAIEKLIGKKADIAPRIAAGRMSDRQRKGDSDPSPPSANRSGSENQQVGAAKPPRQRRRRNGKLAKKTSSGAKKTSSGAKNARPQQGKTHRKKAVSGEKTQSGQGGETVRPARKTRSKKTTPNIKNRKRVGADS